MKRLSALLIIAGILAAAYPVARYAYTWYWQTRLLNAWEKGMMQRNSVQGNPVQGDPAKEAVNGITPALAKSYSERDDTLKKAIENGTEPYINSGPIKKTEGIFGTEDIIGKRRKNINSQGELADETGDPGEISGEQTGTSKKLKGAMYGPAETTEELEGASNEIEGTIGEPRMTSADPEGTIGEPRGTPADPESTSEQPQEPGPENKAVLKNMLGILEIAKIKVRLPILDGTSEDNLRIGAGKLEGTAPIGEIGNTVISAHRSHTYGWLFNRLNELEIGDEIKITTAESTYSYIVFDIKVVEPSDNSALVQNDSDRLLTLTTCDPLYIASHRLIIQARME